MHRMRSYVRRIIFFGIDPTDANIDRQNIT